MPIKKADRLKSGLKKFSNYILIFFLLMFVLSLARNISKTKKAYTKISEEETRVNKLREENQNLQKQLEEMKSPEYIEKQIRNNLGLVKEGEIVVILPDEETLRSLAPQDEVEEDVLPEANWKRWLNLFL
ncbi:hypothetical protein A2W13_02820 [Candidatus Woesebacteria bacterium RBG_16_36_11]|uniref:Cell division protein FtsL n=3 Tax=Candidatus Woeseibacteriota TaxID=1752722 RepID=A0A1F7X7R3_9BACT|nr:MAG: hypothetical protein A2Z67_05505 [Candidatus Woesebacteria bacterium RBG_13_36_22]OGM11096.1 MAG: hypothetical protein A2W13_02820 [Candidatus Woesebacteria bacterium RBG_16_36_11]OGM17157.1 MAG: hypothetical protein A2V55_00445 [Candidatus Woesebacteria bacterium RBG_19FT_COMBO_37_29]